MSILKQIGVDHPIVQAPMAGISTSELAAAVSNAGGLGSISIGATNVDGAETMVTELKHLTDRPFNVNLFVHQTPRIDLVREREWLRSLAPEFEKLGAHPPETLRTIYTSFADDDEMFELLLGLRPPVVSFHFGVPSKAKITALKSAGCTLLATATNLQEAEAAEIAGIDGIVAQGYEAGGHRGVFDLTIPDQKLGTIALTRLLVARCARPVIAAGGIMDGAGIASAMALGAEGVQMGTAFVACDESNADAAYRSALVGEGAHHTEMTRAISGRPARCLSNKFLAWARDHRDFAPPSYPRAYDAGKALNAAGKAAGEFGYGAQWAGQGAPLARAMSAAELIAVLVQELEEANGPRK